MMQEPNVVEMIIPTVMIPLTLIGVGISVVATFIASLFGVKLNAEGPKKLLEVLIKPRVLVTALLLNAVGWGLFKGWIYWKNYPRLISTIQKENKKLQTPSEKNYSSDSFEKNLHATVALEPSPQLGYEQSWRFESGSGIFSSPVVAAGSVFFGNRGGLVYELDSESGKLIRNFYVGSPVTPKVSLWKNSLYVGEGVHDLHHARVYKFDLKSGAYVDSYQTKGHIEAQSVISEFNTKALMFVPAGADGLHAVDPNTMQGAWKVNHGHVDSAVAAKDGLVFMGTGREKDNDKKNKCYAVALDFNTGEAKWKHELPGSSWIVPTLTKEDVCYVIGEVYFHTERGHVLCFNQKTGEHSVAFNLDEPIVAIPVVVDDDLFVSTINGTLCSYDLEKRSQNWCHKGNVDGSAYAGPSYDSKRNLIVYPTYKEGIKVFHPKTGALLGAWKPNAQEGEWVKTYANANVSGDHWVFSDYVSSVRSLKAFELDKKIKKLVKK